MLSPRKLAFLPLVAGLLGCAAAVWAQVPPGAPSVPPDSTLRREPGLRDRQMRWARTTSGNILMLPAYALRLPFQLLNEPVERYLIHKDPGAVTVYTRETLRTLGRQGIHVRLGGLGSGSGTGGGLIFRPPLRMTFGKPLTFSASVTYRLYESYSVKLDSLHFGPLPVALGVVYNDKPQEDFWGLGPHSSELDRSTYRLEETVGSLLLSPHIHAGWGSRVWLGASHNRVTAGRYDDLPNSQDIFDPAVYEGLAGTLDFFEYGAELVLDTRDSGTYARHGTLGVFGIQGAQGISDTDNAYLKYVAEVRQHFPLPGYRRSLALRARTVVTDNLSSDHPVPVFRLEAVGSSRTVRGYRTYRFTEEDAVLANIEYRFPIWTIEPPNGQAVDGAAFFDFGTALRDLRDLQQKDLRSSAGVGFRFVTKFGLVGRSDVAFTSEGWRIHWSLRATI